MYEIEKFWSIHYALELNKLRTMISETGVYVSYASGADSVVIYDAFPHTMYYVSFYLC